MTKTISLQEDSEYEEIQQLYKVGFNFEQIEALFKVLVAFETKNFTKNPPVKPED